MAEWYEVNRLCHSQVSSEAPFALSVVRHALICFFYLVQYLEIKYCQLHKKKRRERLICACYGGLLWNLD